MHKASRSSFPGTPFLGTAHFPSHFRPFHIPTDFLQTAILLCTLFTPKIEIMNKKIMAVGIACLFMSIVHGQSLQKKDIPAAVSSALAKKYPEATRVTWEKEKGNYEANWGGKSGEDNSVQFTPSGDFIEIVKAMAVSDLPASIPSYIKEHYKGARITEAGKVTNAAGKTSYEVEVHKKDLLFDEKGNFIKAHKSRRVNTRRSLNKTNCPPSAVPPLNRTGHSSLSFCRCQNDIRN